MNPKSLLMGIPKVRLLLSWKSWIEYIMKVSKVPLVVKAFDPNGFRYEYNNLYSRFISV